MSEQVHYFDPNDDRMTQAVDSAQDTFKFLWRELSWETRRIVPGLDMNAVKRAFPTRPKRGKKAGFEHMWVGEIWFDGITITGNLLNQPNDDAGVQQGDQISFPLSELTDWMYAMDGHAFGGFSIQAMRSAMPAAERTQHDKAWGLKFGKAGVVRLTEELTYDDYRAMDPMQIPEHPMSINMRKESAKGLKGLGKKINDPLVGNLTALHYEALAGNLTQATLCIEHGAKKQTKDGNGKTALDHAKVMGWKKIEKLLA